FALAYHLFFPGIATHDAIVVYDQAYAGKFGDWQPPLLGCLWIRLEPYLGYGPQALFVPTIAIVWASLFVLFLALRRLTLWPAWLMLLVGYVPSTFALTGIIWRDVIFTACWMLAIALTLLSSEQGRVLRILAMILALILFFFGFFIRPNALFAAVPILIYLIWARSFSWKRLVFLFVPLVLALQLASGLVNYGWLNANREQAVHSIFVFDLTGISHFADKNVFPIDDWTPEEVEKVKTICYEPTYWDAIWWPRCSFAMARINRDEPPGTKLFGSPVLQKAWMSAILANPVAYVEHRFNHFRALLLENNMILFDQTKSGQFRFRFIGGVDFTRFQFAVDWMGANTPLFRGLTWLLLSFVCLVISATWRNGPLKAATLGMSISAFVYTMTYLGFGVAAEYRYVYWTTFSSLVSAVLVLAKWVIDRRAPVETL
ncbi:MAG: hypothetical protein WCH83_18395, partial [Alphaproteobacteria bacterium]